MTLTYGILPTFAAFAAAFEAACPEGVYHVTLNTRDSDLVEWVSAPGGSEWTAEETWETLARLTNCWAEGDPYAADYAGDFASAILTTLGFEWV